MTRTLQLRWMARRTARSGVVGGTCGYTSLACSTCRVNCNSLTWAARFLGTVFDMGSPNRSVHRGLCAHE